MNERRKCIRCEDGWDPIHKCHIEDNSKKLYTCEAQGNGESDVEESKNEEEDNAQNISTEDDETPIISLVSMTSINQPQKLKLKAHIKNKDT